MLELHVYFLPKLWSQVHYNTMCFSFDAKTMVANSNQLLEELHEFCWAGDDDSVRRVFLFESSVVVNAEKVDLTKLPMDVLWTSLIPVIDSAEVQ